MGMNLTSVDIKVELVEEGTKKNDDIWFRVKGKNLKTQELQFYSWWNSDIIPKVGKTYSIRYSLSKPDYKNRQYKNIKDVVEVEIGEDGYIEVNKDNSDYVETTTSKIQKSYSELEKENQTESLLNILIEDVKKIKKEVEDLTTFVYSEDIKK